MDPATPSSRYSRKGLLTRGAALGALAVLPAACGSSSSSSSSATTAAKAKLDGDLTFFNWNSYIDQSIVKAFEKKYGVKVNQVYYASSDEAVSKAASGEPYDSMVIDSTQVPRLLAAGLLQPIDHTQAQYWDDVLDFFKNPFYDPDAAHTTPYDIGGVGVAWNPQNVSGMTGSFNDVWSTPSANGHLFVLDDMVHTMGMALLHLGYDQNSADPDQLHKAADALIDLKPRLAGISSNDYTMDSNQAWLTPAWSGDIYNYIATNPSKKSQIQYQTCKEGALFTADSTVILKAAKHPGTAAIWNDFLISPENVATNTAYIGYPIPTKSGLAAYKKLTVAQPWLNIPSSLINDPSTWLKAPLGSRLTTMTTEWTRFKAA